MKWEIQCKNVSALSAQFGAGLALGSKDTFEPQNECLHLQGYSLKEFVKTGARISCLMCKVKEVPHILNDLSGKLKYFFIMILCDIAGECKEHHTVASISAVVKSSAIWVRRLLLLLQG